MKGTDKTKRQEGNNSQDRFYVCDIIKGNDILVGYKSHKIS